MTKTQKFLTILVSVFYLLCAFLILCRPVDGYRAVVFILDIALLVMGFSQLIYFFTMARHKVGGLTVLYKSIFLIDMGILIMSYKDSPKKIVMIYLIVLIGIQAAIDIMNAIKGIKIKSDAWKTKLLKGLLSVAVIITCICNINSTETAAIIFAIGLIIEAIAGIVQCFKNTQMLYVG